MSVFVRKDPRLLACADPPWPAALGAMLRRHAYVAAALLALAALAYAANVALGLHAAAQVDGTVDGLALEHPVTIARDARGIPHIQARDLHDLFFAQGFAQASDRLFQMDVTRRYAYGRLAEVFGAKALSIDEDMRAADLRGIAARQWRGSDAQTRRALEAFSDGVNAAMQREPLPVEFRLALYRPQAWTPQDSIAVSLVAALELGDSWFDVIARDGKWRVLGARCFDLAFPLSDSRYDVSLNGDLQRQSARANDANICDDRPLALVAPHARTGSNAWAAGSARTATHRALLANDPHVDLTIPGIWYVMDLQAPGLHAAGAIIPGLPGIALGHNERVAWAVTNADVATSSVYRAARLPLQSRAIERFDVRFAHPVLKAYYRTRDAFSITGDDGTIYWVRWPPYAQRMSTMRTMFALDRASGIPTAMRALSGYRGAPQNFIVADRSGAIAYHLAGAMYDDPAWGRYVHPASDLRTPLRIIPFAALPARSRSRDGILLTANNRVYGRGYPYRLSAAFEPPYRAFRIAQLLHARKAYDVAYFARMQMDACSPIDTEISHDIASLEQNAALAHWNGCLNPASTTASLEIQVRNELLEQTTSLATLVAQLRHPNGDLAQRIVIPDDPPQWGKVGEVTVDHPMSSSWYGLLRGATLPGDGDEYTIHLQEPGFAQGFRAVWDVGNWDAGGILLPSGESGEPGSGHYDDQALPWIRGTLTHLPFTPRAVARATVHTLTLQ